MTPGFFIIAIGFVDHFYRASKFSSLEWPIGKAIMGFLDSAGRSSLLDVAGIFDNRSSVLGARWFFFSIFLILTGY